MVPAIEFVTAILLPVGAVYGLIGAFRVARWAGERRDSHNITEPEPIERLAVNLRRLRAQLETLETRTDGQQDRRDEFDSRDHRVKSPLVGEAVQVRVPAR